LRAPLPDVSELNEFDGDRAGRLAPR